MNYLTQIVVNKSEAARSRLADLYSWHCGLWSAFQRSPDSARDFLFRLDAKRDQFRVLLLSNREPEPAGWGEWQTKIVPVTFLNHSRYAFNLRANPTIKRVMRDDTGERQRNGLRTAIYDEPGLRNWFLRKSKQNGFGFAQEELLVSPALSTFFRKKGQRGKLVQVDFSGVLTVHDRDQFARAFERGIGSAKAFGFGMLMLQPIPLVEVN